MTHAPEITLRPLRSGDLGWIIRRQGMLYAQEYGWDQTFEGLVAEIAGKFVQNFDPVKENAWVAARGDDILGAIFLVHDTDARAKGYKTLTLWTNDILTAARAIYLARGFKLIAEEKHHSFGVDLVGQNWTLTL